MVLQLPNGPQYAEKSVAGHTEHGQKAKVQAKEADGLDQKAAETGGDKVGAGEHNAKAKDIYEQGEGGGQGLEGDQQVAYRTE